MHPKNHFWKDFLSLDIQRAIIETSIQKHILYLYIFTWKFFVFIIFLFSLLFCSQGCITIFLKRGDHPVSRKRPPFFNCARFVTFFSVSFEKESHWNTFLLRFCERYYDFFCCCHGRSRESPQLTAGKESPSSPLFISPFRAVHFRGHVH